MTTPEPSPLTPTSKLQTLLELVRAPNLFTAAADVAMGFRGDEIVVRKSLRPGDHIYGLGEKTGWLDKRHRRYTMRTTDVFLEHPAGIGAATDPLYASFPVFIVHSAEGSYGIFLDNPEFSTFDFTEEDAYEFAVPAAALTYYLFARSAGDESLPAADISPSPEKARRSTTLNLLICGGQEAVQVILGTIPMLILAIFLVNILKASGAIALLETFLTPLFQLIGFPVVAVLPLATKYLAGGTAMMGVTLNLLQEGAITVQELNRMAGFITNPCDLVGVAVLISAGQRCASVVRPVIAGVVVGVLLRGILHLLIF